MNKLCYQPADDHPFKKLIDKSNEMNEIFSKDNYDYFIYYSPWFKYSKILHLSFTVFTTRGKRPCYITVRFKLKKIDTLWFN
jgi:hypothetical protein